MAFSDYKYIDGHDYESFGFDVYVKTTTKTITREGRLSLYFRHLRASKTDILCHKTKSVPDPESLAAELLSGCVPHFILKLVVSLPRSRAKESKVQ